MDEPARRDRSGPELLVRSGAEEAVLEGGRASSG